MSASYNIAIIGQTGVGKSSLINYLFGQEVAKSGTGGAVTPIGFHEYKHRINDMPVNVYDSWGLEVGKEEQWSKELDAELKKRGLDKDAAHWFHSVFYCIAAPSARVQDADINIIKKLLEAKYKVSVVLTKAESLEENEEEQLKQAIFSKLKLRVPVILVSSTSKKLRWQPEPTKPFGKEDIEKQSMLDLVDSLVLRIPAHCEIVMKNELRNWQSEMKSMIRRNVGAMGLESSKVKDRLSEASKDIVPYIFKKGDEAKKMSVNHYSYIAKHLNRQIRLYEKTNNSNPYMESGGDSSFEWYWIPALIVATPFALVYFAFSGKEDAINDLNTELTNFVDRVEKKIDEQVLEMSVSLSAIQERVKNDLVM